VQDGRGHKASLHRCLTPSRPAPRVGRSIQSRGIECRLSVGSFGEGVILDIVLGIFGAIVGGFLFSLVGAAPLTGFNIYTMIVAVIGAIVVLVIYHAIARRRALR
jgi:uncharacterized membrane protein YeaQ/YmgE (transglycosylase-associated protein family)